MKEMRLLLHVSDNERWSTALGNAINFLKDVGEDKADVVIVANGSAAASYAYSDKVETMEVLAERGVKVSIYAVWHFLDHEGLSFKKNTARQRARSSRRGASAGQMEASPGQA